MGHRGGHRSLLPAGKALPDTTNLPFDAVFLFDEWANSSTTPEEERHLE
jgi:hypothetical protein